MTHVQAFLKDEQGITTVEIILILVGIFTPYYGVGIRCKNMWINSTINTGKGGKCAWRIWKKGVVERFS